MRGRQWVLGKIFYMHKRKDTFSKTLDLASHLSEWLWAPVEHYQVTPDFSSREILVSSTELASAACLSPRSREP